jgi:hypothetical protein
MSRFAPALRRAARELDLPRTVRSAILAELAADLEALFEHHRARGLGLEEAERRAEEQVLGSAEVIRRLGRLHQGSWREWSESVGARLSGGIDLILVIFGILPVLLVAGGVAFNALATGPASPLVWPLCVLGALLGGAIPAELIRLLRGAPGRPRRLRLLLALSTLALALGLLALVHGAYDSATTLAAMPVAAEVAAAGDASGAVASNRDIQRLIASIVIRDGAALLISLLLAIAGGLSWFVLLNRSAEQVAREVDRILEGAPEDQRSATERQIIPLTRRRRA